MQFAKHNTEVNYLLAKKSLSGIKPFVSPLTESGKTPEFREDSFIILL